MRGETLFRIKWAWQQIHAILLARMSGRTVWIALVWGTLTLIYGEETLDGLFGSWSLEGWLGSLATSILRECLPCQLLVDVALFFFFLSFNTLHRRN